MNPIQQNNSSDHPQKSETDRIRWLREQIAELEKSWPAHSVPARMLQRLEELEEELENELRKVEKPDG